jgi:hypothetical protein
MRIHLTLLDIHPSALARDLVVLMLLNDCMAAGVSPTTLAEIKATLMYTYAGSVMPPYAHARFALPQRKIIDLAHLLADSRKRSNRSWTASPWYHRAFLRGCTWVPTRSLLSGLPSRIGKPTPPKRPVVC